MSDDDYEVGYGKPPKSGRFKKGKSGNPKGRPKKVAGLRFLEDINKMIMDEAREEVTINNRSGTEILSSIQAVVKQLKVQGLKGDRLAGKEFIKMVRQASEGEKESFEELMQVIIDSVKNLEHLNDEEFQRKSGATKEDVTAMLAKLLIHKGNRFPDT